MHHWMAEPYAGTRTCCKINIAQPLIYVFPCLALSLIVHSFSLATTHVCTSNTSFFLHGGTQWGKEAHHRNSNASRITRRAEYRTGAGQTQRPSTLWWPVQTANYCPALWCWVSQGILKAFNFLLPGINTCPPLIIIGHWVVRILSQVWQCLGSGQIALHLEAAGRLLLQFLMDQKELWHNLATESQHFEGPFWWDAINEIQQKALARDSRRETANDSASLCKGLRGWNSPEVQHPNKGRVKTSEIHVTCFFPFS